MKRESSVDLSGYISKFRAFTNTHAHSNRGRRPSRAIVREENPVQQTLNIPRDSFEYSDSYNPNRGVYIYDNFNENFQCSYTDLLNLPTSDNSFSGASNFTPGLETNIPADLLTTSVQDILSVNPAQPITTNYINQEIINDSAFLEADITKRMEQLNVTEVIEDKPSDPNSDDIPKKLPSRPNPPHLPGSDGPRYVRASQLFVQYFCELDRNNDGKISFIELQECLKNRDVSNYTNFSDETIRMLIETFDDDNDNAIDIKEFPKLAAFLGNWGRCFTFLDKDNSGTIDYEEMHLAMETLGFTLNSTFMKELIQKYNRNNSAVVDFDNFILACVTLCRFKESYNFMKKNCGSASSHISLESYLKMSVLSPTNSQNA